MHVLAFSSLTDSTTRAFEVPQGRQRSKFEARLIARADIREGGLFEVSRSSLRLTFNGRLGLRGGSSQKVLRKLRSTFGSRVVELRDSERALSDVDKKNKERKKSDISFRERKDALHNNEVFQIRMLGERMYLIREQLDFSRR